jgi:hypothetical protein
MLIWKVIAANPGITRAEIWKRVEHSIPDGYAMRVYAQDVASQSRKRRVEPAPLLLDGARGYVLTRRLKDMRRGGVITWEGDGNERRYAVARELRYRGNPDAIDETGTKAAEHMAIADALRVVERLLAQGDKLRTRLGSRQISAIETLAKAVRSKGSKGEP